MSYAQPTRRIAEPAAVAADRAPVQERSHLAFLDGMRALAALWVVLSHIWISEFGLRAHGGLLGLTTNWTLYSHLAVDVFIVLSGFCLILPVRRAGGLVGGAMAFYARRARRILPPFYAALLLSLLLPLGIQAAKHQPLGLPLRAVLVNVFLLQDVFLDQNIFNGPFWSIAVEWRIYFLFPVLVWTLWRWGRTVTLVWTAALGYALTFWLYQGHMAMLMTCPWYLFLFCLGVCAGWTARDPRRPGGDADAERRWGWGCVLGALASCGLIGMFPITNSGGSGFGHYMPLIDAAVGTATAFLLLFLSAAARSSVRICLAWRPLAYLGGFAYSLYLVHMPCLLLLRRALISYALSPFLRVSLLAIIGLPLILAAAYLFFLICERPFLKRATSRILASVRQHADSASPLKPSAS